MSAYQMGMQMGGGGTNQGSRRRSRSPPRKRHYEDSHRDTTSHHEISLPRFLLTSKSAGICEISQNYNSLYIPSHFARVSYLWQDQFPMHHPLKLLINGEKTTDAIKYHVIDKDINWTPTSCNTGEQQIIDYDALLEPADADYSWVARLILINMPAMSEIYKRFNIVTHAKEEKSTTTQASAPHPADNLQLIMGSVSPRDEPLAIGGPWSPSLDGPNPADDPQVLIRTAIRTCKAMTGLDLESCTVWHRLLEFKYYRSADNDSDQANDRTGGVIETVVFFVPEVWSDPSPIEVPSEEEYQRTKSWFAEELQRKLNPAPEPEFELEDMTGAEAEICEGHPDDVTNSTNEQQSLQSHEQDHETSGEAGDDAEGSGAGKNTGKATHFSALGDLRTLKVAEIRQELEARGLSSKGLKAQIITRLQKAVDEEEEAEQKNQGSSDKQPTSAATAETKSGNTQADAATGAAAAADGEVKEEKEGLTEKEKERLTQQYTLPEHPCVILRPHPKAKNGRLRLRLVSLYNLLAQYGANTKKSSSHGLKEYTFEVVIFAEQFNEMLQRDAAFTCYKAMVVTQPEHIKPVPTSHEIQINGGESLEKKAKIDSTDKSSVDKKKVWITSEPNLLLSFLYFDSGKSGYLLLSDLEKLAHSLGVSLSRNQMKDLLNKVSKGAAASVTARLKYHSLTDVQVDVDDSTDAAASHSLLRRNAELEDMDYIIELSLGNKALLISDAMNASQQQMHADGENNLSVSSTYIALPPADDDGRITDTETSIASYREQSKQLTQDLISIRSQLGQSLISEKGLKEQVTELQSELRKYTKGEEDYKQLVVAYYRLLRYAKDNAERTVRDVERQLEKERVEKGAKEVKTEVVDGDIKTELKGEIVEKMEVQ